MRNGVEKRGIGTNIRCLELERSGWVEVEDEERVKEVKCCLYREEKAVQEMLSGSLWGNAVMM